MGCEVAKDIQSFGSLRKKANEKPQVTSGTLESEKTKTEVFTAVGHERKEVAVLQDVHGVVHLVSLSESGELVLEAIAE